MYLIPFHSTDWNSLTRVVEFHTTDKLRTIFSFVHYTTMPISICLSAYHPSNARLFCTILYCDRTNGKNFGQKWEKQPKKDLQPMLTTTAHSSRQTQLRPHNQHCRVMASSIISQFTADPVGFAQSLYHTGLREGTQFARNFKFGQRGETAGRRKPRGRWREETNM